MSKILLDYFMPIATVEAIPEASTAHLKQVCVIANPKAGQEGNVGTIYECTTMAAVEARTDNDDCQQLFAAGMTKVFLLLADELDLDDSFTAHAGEFYTVLISSDFDDDDVTATKATGTVTISSYANLLTTTPDTIEVAGVVFTAQASAATLGTATFRAATSNDATATSLAAQINGHAVASTKVVATVLSAVLTIEAKLAGVAGNAFTLAYVDVGTAGVGASVSGAHLAGGDGLSFGEFTGVIGLSSEDTDYLAAFAANNKQCGFFRDDANGAANMFYAFGKLLSNLATWMNQQFISMPADDGVTVLGDAVSMFDDRISFVITDAEFGKKLSMFCAGGRAIVAPYIEENIRIDIQSRAITWISANQPQYTQVEASLLEQRLQQDVLQVQYIDTGLIEAGVISISLLEANFVGNADINITDPTALWRIFGTMATSL